MTSIFDSFMSRTTQREMRAKYGDIFAYIVSKIVYRTSKNRFHISEYARQHPFIACLWHRNFLMMPYLYRKIRKEPRMSLVTSTHDDGAIVERYFGRFGLQSIRGSSRHSGARALIQAIRELKNGRDIAVTPDGPKGPAKSIANGILSMAMKSGVGICGCFVKPRRYWELNTWDRFCIPKPFTHIDYYISEPLFLPQNLELDEARKRVAKYMERVEGVDSV